MNCLSILRFNAQANTDVSKCVFKDLVTGKTSPIIELETVESGFGPAYNSQEANFENLSVIFTSSLRNIKLLKNNKNLASAQATISSGGVITLSSFDTKSGAINAEINCKLFF